MLDAEAGGTFLGCFEDAHYETGQGSLEAGDVLVLYTDGVTEAHRGRQLFGEKRLSAALAGCAGSDAETMADAVQRAVQDFTEGPRRDDVAVLVLSVEGSSP